jgi:hypothetical protein
LLQCAGDLFGQWVDLARGSADRTRQLVPLVHGALVSLRSGEFPAADPILDVLAVDPHRIGIGIALQAWCPAASAATPGTSPAA